MSPACGSAVSKALLFVAVLVSAALAGCSDDEESPDTDGDGLSDAEEGRGWRVTVTDVEGDTSERSVASRADVQDTDADGVLDLHEYLLVLDPGSNDTDEDGLSDCEEVQHKVREECEQPDWEGETDEGWKTRADKVDTDGDRLGDGDEVKGFDMAAGPGTIHVTADPLDRDSDNDFLDDGHEREFGSNPRIMDSDGDTCDDGVDAFPDRSERFAPGLIGLDLEGEPGDARFMVRLADALAPSPGGQQGVALDSGHNDLERLDDTPVEPGSCATKPTDPWVRVELLVEQLDRPAGSLYDFHGDNPGDQFFAFWNVRDGNFSWTHSAASGVDPFEGPLVWRGPDGTLTWSPETVFS
jgi:hypothetical protein